jgi:hypothetical protein
MYAAHQVEMFSRMRSNTMEGAPAQSTPLPSRGLKHSSVFQRDEESNTRSVTAHADDPVKTSVPSQTITPVETLRRGQVVCSRPARRDKGTHFSYSLLFIRECRHTRCRGWRQYGPRFSIGSPSVANLAYDIGRRSKDTDSTKRFRGRPSVAFNVYTIKTGWRYFSRYTSVCI